MKATTIALLLLMLLLAGTAAADTSYPGNVTISGNLDVGGEADIGGELDQIGNMSNLTTTEQSSIVGAINEVDAHADTVTSYVVKFSMIAGGAAGNHTLTGIAVGDALAGVVYLKDNSPLAVSDISSEFSGTGKGILATNVIANGGGTNTSGGFLLISWVDKTA